MRSSFPIWVTIFSTLAFCQAPQPATQAATTKKLNFTTQIKKTVTFIELSCQKGVDVVSSRGTGFFVEYPEPRISATGAFVYLVTNRHVAECWDGPSQPMRVNSISLRFNFKDGTSKVDPLNPSGNVAWIFPTDNSVDLAIFPLLPDENKVDYMKIPTPMFATDDVVASQDISEGTKILFTGFFYQFPGTKRMQPILREGILAMMPDEDLVTTAGIPGKIYLGDVHIFGGNSGSPVFVDLGGFRGGNLFAGEKYLFLGVVSGLFFEDQDFDLHVATTLKGTNHGNSGIALIVPANALKTLLDDPRLQRMRDEGVEEWKKTHPVTPSKPN